MISLLGSLLGFGSSLVGPVLETRNKSSDQKHELAMLHAQAEVQSKIQDQKLEATIVEIDMAEIVAAHKEQVSTVRKGPVWLAALSGSVRPPRSCTALIVSFPKSSLPAHCTADHIVSQFANHLVEHIYQSLRRHS